MSSRKTDEDAERGRASDTAPSGASKDELEAIFRTVGDGITVQGPGGELVYANDAAARLCGLTSGEELLSLSATELLERFEFIGEDGSPLGVDNLPNRRAYVSRAPESGVVGYRVLATGEERWSELRSTPIFTDGDRTRLVINVFRDITDERRAKAACASSPRRARSSPPRSTTRRRSRTWRGCSSPRSPTTASSTWSTTP